MPVLIVLLALVVALAFGGVVLLSLALRYRAGTARRQARRWVATTNVWLTALSAMFFLFFTALMSLWVGPVVRFAIAGMLIGGLLGLLGLVLTRWESEPAGLSYTPNRWLALLITVAITARLIYGWWHATHSAVRISAPPQHWLLNPSSTQLSVAVGGGLIGYYLIYAIGVRLRLRRHERAALR